jgi:putative transposase
MISFKGAHCAQDMSLVGVRWYVAYPLCYRHVAELMEERGVSVDHATLQRWVVQDSPQLEEALHRRKRSVWVSWRMDATSIQVQGEWDSLARAVDQQGQPRDFLWTEPREEQAAKRFLTKALRRHGVPEKITSDGRAAKKAASESYTEAPGTASALRQSTSLNTMGEPDPRAVKRVTRLMLGCKASDAAQGTLAGVEFMHMSKQRQLVVEEGEEGRAAAEPCDALSASSPHRQGQLPLHDPLSKICDRARQFMKHSG